MESFLYIYKNFLIFAQKTLIMNIQQLEYLIAVDKYKHFGKAAQACFITQPTLSAMVQKLEEELEVKIFDRTSHPIRTTDVGVQIIDQAKSVLDSIMELKQKANQLNNILAGKINIGIIPTVSSFLLPNEIFDFLHQNPKIEMNIREMNTENIIKDLKSGELDAGIISTPYTDTEEFFSDFMFNEELLIYASDEEINDKSFQYTPNKKLNLDKLWLLEEGNCLRMQAESICQLKENVLKPQNLEYSATNMSTLIQMVDKIGGVTIVPELAINQLSNEQKQKISHFRKPYPSREISLIYYKPNYKQKIFDELVAFIKQTLAPKLNYHKNPKDFAIIKP